MPVEVDDGVFYGWEDRLWGGCSTWCSVAEFVQGAWASSTLANQGDFSYATENIYNDRRENTWAEGVEGDGIGEYIKMYYEDEYLGIIELEDTMYPQYIDISLLGLKVGNGEEASFRFEIADVYKGEKHADTCITGILIEFDGRKAH